MIYFILFIFGSIFGSFLNVLIDRFSTDRSVVTGRSYCESCKKTLSAKELVPLLSYLAQKGKCVHCKAKIPSRLFLVEATFATTLPFIYLYGLNFGLSVYTILLLSIIIFTFIGVFFADLEYGLIPDKFLLISSIAIMGYIFAVGADFINHFLSGFGSFVFFLALFVGTKGRGMGFGDVKLAFVIGLFLGFPLIAISLYLSFITGALISIFLVMLGKVKFSKGIIPFGPFMIASTIAAFFFGESHLLSLLPFLR